MVEEWITEFAVQRDNVLVIALGAGVVFGAVVSFVRGAL